MKQKTIKQAFSFDGKGLHTGAKVHATFLPASQNMGICLRRTDLEGRPCFEALAKYVSATERSTGLANGEWKVSTIEHALSALYAMGITNCIIELDAPEMPILDGSATPFVEAIRQVGIEEQEAEAKTLIIKEPIKYEAKNGSTYIIEPADQEDIMVYISFPGNVLHNQSAKLHDLREYPETIAAARTFCFVREVAYLLHKGLIRGGDLQNALVIYEQPIPQDMMDILTQALGQPRQNADKLGYLSPLKFPNEPARHKLLDLLGDFALMGVRLQARITASRPGHGANTECVRHLVERFEL